MLEFPLALSYEPRLLPLAVANGFRIDVKVCDLRAISPMVMLTIHVGT